MYSYDILPEAREYVDGMPAAALASYTELIGFMELTPWDAPAYRQDKPDANMRKMLFGHHQRARGALLGHPFHLVPRAGPSTDPHGPHRRLPYWGWGAIPDQYDREFDGDDGETELGKDPQLIDLPPLRTHWGPRTR